MLAALVAMAVAAPGAQASVGPPLAPGARGLPLAPGARGQPPAPVDAAVWDQVESGNATFLVRIRGPLPWEEGAHAGRLTPEAIVAAGAHRARLLADTLDRLKRAGHVTRTEPFPASRVIAVDGDEAAVRALAADPAVEEVRPDAVRAMPDAAFAVQSVPDTSPASLMVPAAHLARRMPDAPSPSQASGAVIAPQLRPIRAPEAWSKLGVTGEGTVIAVLDTGVDWTHPGLLPGYRGRDGDHSYDWFDATDAGRDLPFDDNGHGTFVAGLAVGSDPAVQTGVAPGAEWVAVKTFDRSGRGRDSWLLRAAEWVLAPSDRSGTRRRPDLAPDIVNASWVLENGVDPLLRPAVAAWRAAGIVPVFAAGNDESGLGQNGTILAPASYPEAIGVGAALGEAAWSLSMGGPSFYGGTSPLILAPIPGQSLVPGGGFDVAVGTSFAAPLVSGAAALMLAAQPDLTPEDVVRNLGASAHDLGPAGVDHLHGYGRLDAFAALSRALFSGRARGTVTLADGSPVNVELTLRQVTGTDVFTVPAPRGAFDVALTEGEWDVTFEGIEVTAGSARIFVEPGITTRLDPVARPVTLVGVTGHVRDELGRPIPGAIVTRVETTRQGPPPSYSAPISRMTDSAGSYQIGLPAGSHTLAASIDGRRAMTESLVIAATTGEAVPGPDFELPASPSIAVVDADADLEERIHPYIERTLRQLGYASTVWAMEPEADESWPPLSADVLIWSHHAGSPGRLQLRQGPWVTRALEDYVRGGGRLLLSGQNVAELDAGSGPAPAAPEFVRDVLRADFVWGNAGAVPVAGRGPLEGVQVRLDSEDGYRWGSSLSPDQVATSDQPGDPAEVAMNYADGLAAGIAAAGELGRRLYLAFALHGTGPEIDRARLVDGALAWLAAPDVAMQLEPAMPRPGQTATLHVWVFGGHPAASAALQIELPQALVATSARGGLELVPGGAAWSGALDAGMRAFDLYANVVPTSGAVDLEIVSMLTADRRAVRNVLDFRVEAPGFETSTLGVSPDRLRAGVEAETTLAIANGGSAAGPVDAVLSSGPGLAFVPGSASSTTGSVATAGNQVRWMGDVAASESVTVTARVVADGSVARPSLTAALDRAESQVELRTELLVGGPELEAALALSDTDVDVGDAVTATMEIVNSGPERAQASARLVAPAGFVVSGEGHWTGAVEAGGRARATWGLQVVTATRGSYTVAVAASDGLLPQAVSTDVTALTVHSPDLARSTARFAPSTALSGELLSGEVHLVNDGDAVANAVTTVALPLGLTTASEWITATHGAVTSTLGGIVWRATVDPGGEEPTLRYGALVGRSVGANTPLAVPHTVAHEAGTTELTAHALVNQVSLAGSTFEARPQSPVAGGRVDFALTVRAGGNAGIPQAVAEIRVPASLALEDGSLTGGLAPDGVSTLVWRGALSAGEERTLGWSATLRETLVQGGQAITLARISAEDVPTVHLAARVEVTHSDLTASTKVMRPAVASRGESISVVLRALNSGPEPVIATVTDALPAGLVFTEGTLWSSRPTVEWDATSRSIRWTGDIETGEAVEIRFAAEYDSDEPVTNIMVVADEAGTRVASWAAVSPLAARLFVPAAARP